MILLYSQSLKAQIEKVEEEKPEVVISLLSENPTCDHFYWNRKPTCALEEAYKQHESEWADVMKGVFEGLKYLHETHDIMHRDIKPGNILIRSGLLHFNSEHL